ncbi:MULTISPECIES: EamA family transporter RarD [Halomonas]|uniref:Permease n=1 Tax=Halomonas halophila TaxID=29573 RepID=A0ABQ0U538_9GAMM|nr:MULTISPECIES: EamA family transporter RarD [Halomonas]MDR5889836.1 EamA family transporter RarD [Halomonas salina]WJY06761.1 EamA family transporter RarD [Halomonas halophila]GEK72853.1 permease [Halomonas halophila]
MLVHPPPSVEFLMNGQPNTAFGVTTNVMASVFFALIFAYAALLDPLEGEEVYGWRILVTFPCLTLILGLRKCWPQVLEIYRRLFRERYLWMTRILSASLLGVQLWIFMWAPANGHGLAVSLGYFIMPITMVILGRIAFKDRMSVLQKLSCTFAVVGVANEVMVSESLTWPTLVICLGYPVYFWLRRVTDTNNIGGLWFDMLLSMPLALFFIVQKGYVLAEVNASPHLIWLVLGLGGISALALTFQSLSAPHLNLSLFGLLIYVEPVLLFLVSISLGESIDYGQWPTYMAIWLAVFVLLLEGVCGLRKERRAA